jgi:PAS domain S-box-containing protein
MSSNIVSERRGSIIVVEDEPVVSIYLRRRLEALGWDVLACVCSGEEAVRVGAQQRPDLMLMDVRLDGDVDGPQAAHQLQDLFGIPSVFLTAYTDRETIERCKGALPLGYLTKPVDEQLLSLTLEMALSFDKKRQARAREEQARRRLEGRYADILKHAPDAILTVDGDLTIVVYSPSAERCFQYSAAEVLGRPLHLLLPRSRSEREEHCAAGRLDACGSPSTRVVDYQRKDGSIFPAEVAICRHEEAGRALYTAIIRDISQRRELERERIGAQKMDAVGRLAASVANDFNNLLQAVGANHYLMAQQARPELSPILQDCAELVARGSSLTRQLLSLSGGDDGEAATVCSLRQLLEQSLRQARRTLGAHVRVLSNASLSEGQVRVVSAQFEQVISTLVSNAKDAMLSGGELGIHAGPHPALSGYVLIEVQDTGLGIAPADLPHLFEPFFTTKPPGVGTGLGLPVVKRMVERWGGRVSVITRQGSGTAFGISLPYAAGDSAGQVSSGHEATGPQSESTPASRERILLLEPNGHVRSALHGLLAARGYSVLSAETAEQAEHQLRASHVPDLAIASPSFLDTPATTLAALNTAALSGRLLLVSGAGGAAALPPRWPALRCPTLLRPFEPAQLLELVRRLLAQPAAAHAQLGGSRSEGR